MHATAAMSLPALLVGTGGGLDCGTGDDPGGGGGPVTAVSGSDAREYIQWMKLCNYVWFRLHLY